MKKRLAFSLLEIVVLLAAMALLGALIFPILARAQPYPDQTTKDCQTKLKYVALGFLQYIQDYDELYPIAKNSKKPLAKGDSWATAIMPYLKSQRVFQCPADSRAKDPEKTSYGYNSWMSMRNESAIDYSSLTVLNYEVAANVLNYTQTGGGPVKVSAPKRHLGGANYSFVDGHVKWYLPGKVGATPYKQGKPTFLVK